MPKTYSKTKGVISFDFPFSRKKDQLDSASEASRFLLQQKRSATTRRTAATPPTTPPTMAPVWFEEEFVVSDSLVESVA